MGWFQTLGEEPGLFFPVEPGVDPMFRANLYTVHGRDADLQPDFGVGVAALRPALPVTGKPVIGVASHAHVDQVGGLHEIAERWGPQAEAVVFDDMTEAGTLQGVFRDWPGALLPYWSRGSGWPSGGRDLHP